MTTPLLGVLPGITRRTVLEICQTLGIPAAAGALSPDALRQASEVFVTSTAGGVMPVTILDSHPAGDGLPGAVTELIRRTYWEWHGDPRYLDAVAFP